MRALAEFSLLKGDLYAEGAGVARMREGVLNHQALEGRYADGMEAEVPLEIRVRLADCELVVSGRADGLRVADGRVTVEEIKSSSGRVGPDSYPAHWAQAQGYALMACEARDIERATVRLVYVHSLSGGGAITRYEREFTRDRLREEFSRLVAPYAEHLGAKLRFEDERDASIRALRFPYEDYRAGQKRMAVAALRALRDGRKLLVQAPTGIGKTVGALFPALKALGKGYVDKVMYLTARRTARRAAWDCVELLRRRGLRARVCALTAKEQICFSPGARCTPQACPYCQGYFDRRRAALDEARNGCDYDAEYISGLARRHQLCPFELSLDMSELADVIICDYNYVFDPNAYLRRYFSTRSRFALLIDEAHNLESRARDMLSAALRFDDYVALYRSVSAQLGGDSAPCARLVELMRAWRAFGAGREGESFDAQKPEALIEACVRFTDATSPALDGAPECAGEWAEKWFGILDFARVGAAYSAQSHSTLYRAQRGGVDVTQLCVDATEHIKKCLKKARAAVMFSATLSPVKYYFGALGLDEGAGDEALELPSPFLSENFLVRRLAIPTRYSQRADSLAPIAGAIARMARAHVGNYIACFPSYAYLKAAFAEFKNRYPDIEARCQRPSMSDRERDAFIARFKDAPERSMVGFIAMGGVFAEGVDLPGDRLSGAAIVGVALPQVCLEREALRAHFDAAQGEGFNYAYVYPGICRVLQAAGRVIRTEDDAGVALLMDDRFFREPYSELLPSHWRVGSARPGELDELLRRFWKGEAV